MPPREGRQQMDRQKQDMQWAELLRQAVSEPGILSSAYRAFHGYSLGNQLAAYWQCKQRDIQPGPIGTFPKWKERGRCVRKGERALTLCMPITAKRMEQNRETGEDREHVFTRFTWRNNWFVLSQTHGAEYQPTESARVWDRARALEQLGISEVPFDMMDGNCQGYAKSQAIAVSPIAVLPHKTTFHELAHVVLGHTSEGTLSDDDSTPRSVREVEAEGVAFLLCSTLELPGLAESRGYLQHWARGESISERSAQRIFSAANTILQAGQEGDGK